MEDDTELLVVGGGPGGYVGAIRAAQLGIDVTLADRAAVGGTCLNHGCIPSKALLSASDVAHRAREADGMGVHANPAVDLAAMVDWKDGVVGRLTGGVEHLLEAAGVTVVAADATFVDDHRARLMPVDGGGADPGVVSFQHALIATGSRPASIPNFDYDDDDPILSSREALALERVPEDLLVVGAGYIGMELSTAFAKLGADVAVVEALDRPLPGFEADLASVVHEAVADLGVDVTFGVTAADWEPIGDEVRVSVERLDEAAGDGAGDSGTVGGTDAAGTDAAGTDAAGGTDATGGTDAGGTDDRVPLEFDAEAVIVAVGREPVTEGLGLDALGIAPTDGGYLRTDERARTDRDHVFAAGDVTGDPMLAHAAMAEGEVAAEVVAGEPAALDHQAIPAAVFTDPEIATAGMTEAEASEAGFDPVVGECPLRANGRALTLDATDGFVRIVADRETGFVLGGQIVGPEASELIAPVTLAIECSATLADVVGTIHTHPTLAEAIQEAARAATGRAIHVPN